MHLGIKNFVGSVKKSLFGDGTYSQNIVQGGSVLQPQASYTAILGNIAATGTFSYTGTQWNGGAYPATQIFNGVNSDWGILDAVVNSSFNWDFGWAVEMQKVRLLLYGGAYNAHDIYADYSDNGVAWSVGYHMGYVAQDMVFHDYALGSAVGAHRYWRLRNASTTIFELSEVQWIEQVQLQNCIVITGAATVAPDAATGASVFSAQNVLIDGGTLAPSTNSKGLIGIVSESIRLINGGRAHIDKLGKAGNFGNLTVLDLVPQSIRRKLKPLLASNPVQGEGAAGAAGSGGYADGKAGSAAGVMQTGGGGSGGLNGYNPSSSGAGGKGGPCCGGSGSPGIVSNNTTPFYAPAATPYGGPGLNATSDTASCAAGGGTGDPVGAGANGGYTPTGGGGGLLMLFTPLLSIASGCSLSADGAAGVTGSNTYQTGSGGAGGGCVVVGTLAGGYTNLGTVRASGGAGTTGASHKNGGPGGVGSVNTFTLAA